MQLLDVSIAVRPLFWVVRLQMVVLFCVVFWLANCPPTRPHHPDLGDSKDRGKILCQSSERRLVSLPCRVSEPRAHRNFKLGVTIRPHSFTFLFLSPNNILYANSALNGKYI